MQLLYSQRMKAYSADVPQKYPPPITTEGTIYFTFRSLLLAVLRQVYSNCYSNDYSLDDLLPHRADIDEL